MRTKEEITKALGPILEEKGFFAVEVKVSAGNVIDVSIDGECGVRVADCIEVSRALEKVLDREKEDFELTVGSAGIGVPFRVPEQYRKNIGNEVEVKLVAGEQFKAVLEAFDGENVVLKREEKVKIDGKKKKETVVKEISLMLDEIRQIKDIVKF